MNLSTKETVRKALSVNASILRLSKEDRMNGRSRIHRECVRCGSNDVFWLVQYLRDSFEFCSEHCINVYWEVPDNEEYIASEIRSELGSRTAGMTNDFLERIISGMAPLDGFNEKYF